MRADGGVGGGGKERYVLDVIGFPLLLCYYSVNK